MDRNNDPHPTREFSGRPEISRRSYPLSGKIMLSVIIILFFIVILMVFFHFYIRWYLRRAERRRRQHRRMVFFVDSNTGDVGNAVVGGGLGDAAIKSLPVFVFSSSVDRREIPVECAVCLSEFEEGESGRILPGCKHSFHVDCIDMWFRSHSTCPLCRSPVEPEKPIEVSVTIPDPVINGSDPAPIPDEIRSPRRRPSPIKLPESSRNAMDGELTRSESPASHGYRSPISRMLSLGRMLSREGRTTPSPSPVARTSTTPSASGASLTESDVELGIDWTRPR